MGILDNLRTTAVTLLDPHYHENIAEAQAIKMAHSSQGGILANQWYRLYNANGNCVGFSFSCACRQEFQMLHALEWFRDYQCPQCKMKFELLKAVGLTADSPIKELESALAKLPIRPRAAGTPPRPRVIDTWAADQSDPVEYTGISGGFAGIGFADPFTSGK